MPAAVVCFGEVLWDLLPSGELPGGAPMNVAYHVKKLGLEPALISRVGKDDYGRRLLQLLQGWGLSTGLVQQDDVHRTGIVYARPGQHHEMTYEIVQPVAWDFIDWEDQHTALVQQAEYFVYGSLGARSEKTRETLLRLLGAANKKVFDINIRPPHFDKTLALQLLKDVYLLKLNEHELPVLAGWMGESGDFEAQVNAVQEHFKIPLLVVTRGAAGAVLRTSGVSYAHPGFKVTVADTVGSGDAFLAGLLSRLKGGAQPAEALAFACAAGAFVASQCGACPQYEAAAIRQLMTQQP